MTDLHVVHAKAGVATDGVGEWAVGHPLKRCTCVYVRAKGQNNRSRRCSNVVGVVGECATAIIKCDTAVVVDE